MQLIAISGGIGSGKSVVSRILAAMGYAVYDCDSRAKTLMDSDGSIKKALTCSIHPQAVSPEGIIDRKIIAETVFTDSGKLSALNRIVHGAVKSDLCSWAGSISRKQHTRAFVETAILYESGLDAFVDEVWRIEAPRKIRIERVKARSGWPEHQITARMDAQDSYVPANPHNNVKVIINDGLTPVLPRIEALLS